ncbi:MAG TPA: hypothetical protein VFN21_08530 [Acidimicrobiales bacterium]|nr:hypothetical protein [Acidimicrobiales bacterium]
MTGSEYFPDAPYNGLTTFEGPELHLAAVQMHDFPLAEMPRLMDGTFPGIFAALDGAGSVVCGPPLSLHSRIPTDTADLALGVPVTAALANELELSSGFRVVGTPCPTGPVAATSYLGGYEGLGEAWGRFMRDIAAAGHTPGTTFFEAYVLNPAETPDLSKLRTDLVLFLA